MPESRFPKPAGGFPARGDASAFLSRDFSEPATPPAAEPAPPPPPERAAATPVRGRAGAVRAERKIPITYKHRESNFKTLKKISHRLDIPIGDLLDEALEARIPEWKSRIALLPPEEF